MVFHEIPQEIGDFGLLVYGGLGKSKALILNFFAGLTVIVGGLVGYFLQSYIGETTARSFMKTDRSKLSSGIHLQGVYTSKRSVGSNSRVALQPSTIATLILARKAAILLEVLFIYESKLYAYS